MKTISTSPLRSQTRSLVSTLAGGDAVSLASLTYRGHRLAHIWPLKTKHGIGADDPLYHFHRLAEKIVKPLDDPEIDRLVYGA